MGKSFEGMLIGKGLKFGLVISRFNEFISSRLLEGAQDGLKRHGVGDADVDIAGRPARWRFRWWRSRWRNRRNTMLLSVWGRLYAAARLTSTMSPPN